MVIFPEVHFAGQGMRMNPKGHTPVKRELFGAASEQHQFGVPEGSQAQRKVIQVSVLVFLPGIGTLSKHD